MFSTYIESEEDLETFMRSMTIATRQNKEMRFLDLFLFEYSKNYDVLDACYKSLWYLKLLEIEGDIMNE
jgi:hypothetical protein